MKQTPKEVLNSLAEHYNISLSELAKRAGYDRPQSFYDVVNGKTKKISAQMAKGISSVFPQVSLPWILTGEGDMLNKIYDESHTSPEIIQEPNIEYGFAPHGFISYLREKDTKLEEKEREIRELIRINATLEAKLEVVKKGGTV